MREEAEETSLECCKRDLIGNVGRNSKDQNADRHVDSEGLTQEGSEGNEDSLQN